MKFIYALLVLCCTGAGAWGQIVALSPTGDGGFETGSSITSNGWTVANPTNVANNQWVVGTAAVPFAGTNSVYISNNGGTAYAYTTGTAKAAHFYRDIVIPSTALNINLSFQWKGFGEVGADRMFISTGDASTVVAANSPVSPSTTIAGATLVWTQPNASTSAYTAVSLPLPVSLAGTTVRLIFSWQTNGSGGISPGGALDNIKLTYDCSVPAPITGTPSACVGSTMTLADASSGGAWSSSNPAVGTITSLGVVTGITGGTTTISYTTVCLSPATRIVSVLAAPAAIGGPSSVCLGGTITLTNTSLGGTWTSSASGIAPVSASGVVSGNTLGTANITYANGCGTPAVQTVTVNPLPAPITLTSTHVCGGGGILGVSDDTPGGTWSAGPSANATAVTVGIDTGNVVGHAGGTAYVTYTSAVGCLATALLTVDPVPFAITGNVPVCVGATALLSDALPGGHWESSVPGVATVGSLTGLVSGIANGTTTISYINGCGAATVTFSVNAYPGSIVGDDLICIGVTASLANPLIGGSWSSSNPSVASVLASSGFVTGLAVGTTRITYTMPGGCSTNRLMTVLSSPPAIIGTMQVCPGGTTTLSDPVSGGTWSSSNPVTATVVAGTGVVTGHVADTAHIIYTTPAGCTVTTGITVNPLPAHIVGNVRLCANQASTLYNADPGGTWTSLTGTIATINNVSGVVAPLAVGQAIFKYTLPTGCSVIDTFEVAPLPVPVVSFNNLTNTLYTAPGYVSYEWRHSVLGTIAGATSRSTPGLHNGSYYVIVTDTNGCIGTSSSFAYTLSMGVDALGNSNSFAVYPNPATDIINISATQSVRAIIYGLDGKKEIEVTDAKSINISKLAKGIYTITLYNQDGVKLTVRKLVKQ